MNLLAALQASEALYGRGMVQQELEKIAYEWDAPHDHERCAYCLLDGFGDWVYCESSRYHVDHSRHMCSPSQECFCKERRW